MADLCADEILHEVSRLYARLAVPVEVHVLSEAMGVDLCDLRPRLAALARGGLLRAVGGEQFVPVGEVEP